MSKRFKAAILGGSGYGGAEIMRRLLRHPHVELARVASVDSVGERVSSVHFSLEGQTDLRFENLSPADAAKGMDVVLLGLPHKVSAEKVPEIMASGARIVDLSGDFRLRDATIYKRYYGAPHPHAELLDGRFVYGLPELNREAIEKAKYIASPGCFATAIELALLPLARAGLLEGPVEIVGITGSSGSGIVPGAGTHHPSRTNNLKTYKPLDHQHIPEIAQVLQLAGAKNVTLRFVPVSAPLSRGIFATSFAHVEESTTADQIRSLYADAYANEPFVRVPPNRLPEVVAVKGTNFAEVGIQLGDVFEGRRAVACFSAVDNLVKGGAGQAIQSMNIMLGVDERLTLEDTGGWP
jgi:LysW-gamma-L-alpha-aminoadipyl-6-phosphate/LysW-L-glutamyl-5-phosphate reductase